MMDDQTDQTPPPSDPSDKLDSTFAAIREALDKNLAATKAETAKVAEAAARIAAADNALASMTDAEPLDLTEIRNKVLTKYGVSLQTDDPVFAVVTAAAEASEQIGRRHVAAFAAVLESYRRNIERTAQAAAERGERTATDAVNQGTKYLETHVVTALEKASDKAIADFKAAVNDGIGLITESVASTSKASQSAWIGAVVSVGCGLLVLGALLSRLI